jgi:XTP/dITP diphosphohydrolase
VRVVLASSNQHKVAEFRRLFSTGMLDVRSPEAWGFPALEVPENGSTFAENALVKARAYCTAYNMPAISDDSGICVDALAGAPGVRSARFGNRGLDDAGRAQYLLACLDGIEAPRRGAHYVCALRLVLPTGEPLAAEGRWYGEVATAYMEGGTGFGYDPVFLVPSIGRTVSRLTTEEKDRLGHRGRAVRKMLAML